ncbi:MAG: SPOR domain-containing protein [Janthinobacterium lividum]
MGIFSFGKKKADANADASSRRGDPAPPARSGERDARVEPGDGGEGDEGVARIARASAARGRSGRKGGQETMLDPTLPEKQRARRRLVGAVALVLAAVVILPMVLDAHPKPVTDDIAISIPAQDTPAARAALKRGHAAGDDADADGANPGEAAAPDAAPGTTELRGNVAANGTANTAARGTAESLAGNPTGSMAGTATAAKPETVKSPVSKSPAATATKTARQTPAGASATASTLPSTPATPGSRYVVQLGNFESEAAARDWVSKLKNIGVPAYVEHTKQADGTMRVMLRAGPFADRAVAQAAVLKVRQAGLSQAGR